MSKELEFIMSKQEDFGLDDLDVSQEQEEPQKDIPENEKFRLDKFLKACFSTWD